MDRYCFAPDSVEVFKPMKIVDEIGDEFELVDLRDPSSVSKIKIGLTYPIASYQELNDPPPDLIKLSVVNRPAILHTLRMRFGNDLIYTSVGPILVALNPFKWIPGIYDADKMRKYYSNEFTLSNEPHVFAMANDALQVLQTGRNQSLIISGESGAGKTEATKQCLNFLASIAGSSNGVQNRILQASPVLEAWGNAKTLRNNNSSRFGKFIEILFGMDYKIVGASNTTYLLEKSRVVFQESGERNYHVFYQLLKGASQEELTELGLQELALQPNTIEYINQSGCIDIEDVDDGKDYQEVQEAFGILGFNGDDPAMLNKIIAGILHFGNMKFTPNPSNTDELIVSPATMNCFDAGVAMFGVDRDMLLRSLLKRKIQSGGKRASVSFTPYSPALAVENKNSMVKEIYSRSFDWIVGHINNSINTTTQRKAGMIGILDIFGFEIFKKNSFEQLCINLANEALQQHFNANIFRVEMDIYKQEDVPLPDLSYNDNQDVLDLIMKRPQGIIPVLDEEGVIPKGSYEGFLTKIVKFHHPVNKRFVSKPLTKEFSVVHYAGEVTYDPKLFLTKNKDTLSLDVIEVLSFSTVRLIALLFQSAAGDDDMSSALAAPAKKGGAGGGGGGASNSNKLTVGKKFSVQLDSLIQNLNTTKPRYIRCIKPNQVKRPNIFVPDLTNEQLTYSGVFEAVIIMQSGYPFRLSHKEFRESYHMIVKDRDDRKFVFRPENKKNPRQLCRDLVATMGKSDEIFAKCYVGTSLVLYRADQNYLLLIRRKAILDPAKIIVFRWMRGAVVCSKYRRLLTQRKTCEASILKKDLRGLKSSVTILEATAQQMLNMTGVLIKFECTDIAKSLVTAIEAEKGLEAKLRALTANIQLLVNNTYDEVVATIEQMRPSINFTCQLQGHVIVVAWDQNTWLVETEKRIKQLSDVVVLKRRLDTALQCSDDLELRDCMAEYDSLQNDGRWPSEINVTAKIKESKALVKQAQLNFTIFLTETLDKIKMGRLVVKRVSSQDIQVTVDSKLLADVLKVYNPESTFPHIKTLMTSKSVQNCISICEKLLNIRVLVENALQACESWENVWLALVDWGLTFGKKSSCANRSTGAVPIEIEDFVNAELNDLAVAAIHHVVVPQLSEAVTKNAVPEHLTVNLTKEMMDCSILERAVSNGQAYLKYFDESIAAEFTRAKEHCMLRSAVFSQEYSQIQSSIRLIRVMPSNEPDYLNTVRYCNLFKSIEDFRVTMTRDGPTGAVGNMSFANVKTDLLASSLVTAKSLEVCDTQWLPMLAILEDVLVLRNVIANQLQDHGLLQIDLMKHKPMGGDSVGARLSQLSHQEIANTLLEIRHRRALARTIDAARHGSVTGKIGQISCKLIQVETLQDALDAMNGEVVDTEDCKMIARDCQVLIAARQGALTSNWQMVDESLSSYFPHGKKDDDIKCHSCVRDEFILLHGECQDLKVRSKLLRAVSSGNVLANTDNEEILVSIQLDEIRSAIAIASSIRVKSSECFSLLKSVQVIYCLRTAIVRNHWEASSDTLLPFYLLPTDQLCSAIYDTKFSVHLTNEKVTTALNHLQHGILKKHVSNNTFENLANLKQELPPICVFELLGHILACGGIHMAAMHEFLVIQRISRERRCRMALLLASTINQVPKSIDDVNYDTINAVSLALLVRYVKLHSKSLSSTVLNWLATAQVLVNIRVAALSAVPSSDNTDASNKACVISLEDYINPSEISHAISKSLHNFGVQELQNVLDMVTELLFFRELIRAFKLGRPMFYMGKFDIQNVDFENMTIELGLAKKFVNRSDKLDRLMFYANLCIQVRKAVMGNQWDLSDKGEKSAVNKDEMSIKQCIAEYHQANRFFSTPVPNVPPISFVEDIRNLEKEWDKRLLQQAVPTAFQSGGILGQPFTLVFRNIRTDLLQAQITKIKAWEAAAGEVDPDLAIVIQATEECIGLRKEALNIQHSFERSFQFAKQTNSLQEILASSFVTEAIESAVRCTSTVSQKPYLMITQWQSMDSLLTKSTVCSSFRPTKREADMLLTEGCVRSFIAKTLEILHNIDVNYRSSAECTVAVDVANSSMSALFDACRTFMMRRNEFSGTKKSSSENSTVLESIFNSAIIVLHFLRADILNLYDKMERDWLSCDPNFVVTPRVTTLATHLVDGAYTIQCIIRSASKLLLHHVARRLLDRKQEQIQDVVSSLEMTNILSMVKPTGRFEFDESDLTSIEVVDMQVVDERIRAVGIFSGSVKLLFDSFAIMLKLRSALQTKDFGRAFEIIDDSYNSSKRDFAMLVEVMCSGQVFVHPTGRSEFAILLRETFNGYWRQIACSALLSGQLSGSRGMIRVHLVDCDQLDYALSFVGSMVSFSQSSLSLIRLCRKIRQLRSIIAWKPRCTDNMYDLFVSVNGVETSILPTSQALSSYADSVVNRALHTSQQMIETNIVPDCEHIEAALASIDSAKTLVTQLMHNEFLSTAAVDSILLECTLAESHCQFALGIQRLHSSLSVPCLWYSSAGVEVSPPLFHLWRDAVISVDNHKLSAELSSEHWWFCLSKLGRLCCDMFQAVQASHRNKVKRSSMSIPIAQLTNQSYDPAGNHELFPVEAIVPIVIPGTDEFTEFAPKIVTVVAEINQLQDWTMNHSKSIKQYLPEFIHKLRDDLRSALEEHDKILKLRVILRAEEIVASTNPISGHYSIIVKSISFIDGIVPPGITHSVDHVINETGVPLPIAVSDGVIERNDVVASDSEVVVVEYLRYESELYSLVHGLEISTTYGQAIQKLAMLLIQLRLTVTIEDWSRVSLLARLVEGANIFHQDLGQDIVNSTTYVQVIAAKRQLEQGIFTCTPPSVIGWSEMICAPKLALGINDTCLEETIRHVVSVKHELVTNHIMILELVELGVAILDLVGAMRCGHWSAVDQAPSSSHVTSTTDVLEVMSEEKNIEHAVEHTIATMLTLITRTHDDLMVESHHLPDVKILTEGYLMQNTLTMLENFEFLDPNVKQIKNYCKNGDGKTVFKCMNELKLILASKKLLSDDIREYVTAIIENLQMEFIHLELEYLVKVLFQKHSIAGLPGLLTVSPAYSKSICELLRRFDVEKVLVNRSYGLQRAKQTLIMLQIAHKSIIQNDLPAILNIIHVLKYMATKPILEFENDCMLAMHLEAMSEQSLIEQKQQDLTGEFRKRMESLRDCSRVVIQREHSLDLPDIFASPEALAASVQSFLDCEFKAVMRIREEALPELLMLDKHYILESIYLQYREALLVNFAVGVPGELDVSSLDCQIFAQIGQSMIQNALIPMHCDDDVTIEHYGQALLLDSALKCMHMLRQGQQQHNRVLVRNALKKLKEARLQEMDFFENLISLYDDNETTLGSSSTSSDCRSLTVKLFVTAAEEEISLATSDMEQLELEDLLIASIISPGVPIVDGDYDVQRINLEKLEASIAASKKTKPVSAKAVLHFRTASYLLDMRRLFVSRSWKALMNMTNDKIVESLAIVSFHEIHRAHRLAHIWAGIDAAHVAYSSGAFKFTSIDDFAEGSVMNLDHESIALALLDLEGIHENWKTDLVYQHIVGCSTLADLRKYLAIQNWDVAYDIASFVLLPERLSCRPLHKSAIQEIRNIQTIAGYKLSCTALCNALNDGKLIGTVGQVQSLMLSSNILEHAVAYAEAIDCSHPRVQSLRRSARVVLEIRRAQENNSWLSSSTNNTSSAEELQNAACKFHSMSLEEALLSVGQGLSVDHMHLSPSVSSPSCTKNGHEMSKLDAIMGATYLEMCDQDKWPRRTVEEIIEKFLVDGCDIASEAKDEINFAKEELAYRKSLVYLLCGVQSAGPSGLPSALDMSTTNTTILLQAIEYAENHTIVSPCARIMSLLFDCKLLLAARTARLDEEWVDLRRVLNQAKLRNQACDTMCLQEDPIYQIDDISQAYFDSCCYHALQPVTRELLYYESDLQFRECLEKFTDEMCKGYVVDSSSSSPDTTAVMVLLADITHTQQCASLCGAAPEYARLLEAQNLALELRLLRIYEPQQQSKEIMQRVAQLIERDAQMNLTSYVSLMMSDVTYMANAANKQSYIESLEKEISNGQVYIHCPVGRIDIGVINNDALVETVQAASALLNMVGSKADLALLGVANMIISVRLAIAREGWEAAKLIAQQHEEVSHSPLIVEEIRRLFVEAENAEICKLFDITMQKGQMLDVVKIAKMVHGPGRNVQLPPVASKQATSSKRSSQRRMSLIPQEFQVAVYDLEKVIAAGMALELKSDETNMLIKAAQYLQKLRTVVSAGAWDSVSAMVIDEVNDLRLPLVVLKEVKAVRTGLAYRKRICMVSQALISGAPTGIPGFVNLSGVNFTLLQESLLRSEDIDMNDPATSIMHEIGHMICSLRRAIKERRWFGSRISLFQMLNTDSNISGNDDIAEEGSETSSKLTQGMSVEEIIIEFASKKALFADLKNILNITDEDEITEDNTNSSSVGTFDWQLLNWRAAVAVQNEISLIAIEVKDRKLMEYMIVGLETVPISVKQFSQRSSHSSDNSDNRRQRSKFDMLDVTVNKNSTTNSSWQDLANSSSNVSVSPGKPLIVPEDSDDPFLIKILETCLQYIRSQIEPDEALSDDTAKLIATGELILKFRIALNRGATLSEYQELLDEADMLITSNLLSGNYGMMELLAYRSTSMTVELSRSELMKGMSSGQITGYLDDINLGAIELPYLEHWVTTGQALLDSAKDLTIGLNQVTQQAKLLLAVRRAVKARSWQEVAAVMNCPSTGNELTLQPIYQDVACELIHARNAHRFYNANKLLHIVLSGEFPVDLEHNYSKLVLRLIELNDVLKELDELFQYRSPLLPDDGNHIVDPNSSFHNTYKCAHAVKKLWNAICHKNWGAELIASGGSKLHQLPRPNDCLLQVMVGRIEQQAAELKMFNVHEQIRTLQQVAPNSHNNIRSSILAIQPDFPKHGIKANKKSQDSHKEDDDEDEDEDEDGFDESAINLAVKAKKVDLSKPAVIQKRHGRVSVYVSAPHANTARMVAEAIQNTPIAAPRNNGSMISLSAWSSGGSSTDNTPSDMSAPIAASVAPHTRSGSYARRRTSVSASMKHMKGITGNASVELKKAPVRGMSIYASVEVAAVSVLEILSSESWSSYPDNIQELFNNSRTGLVDQVIRLRLSHCCTFGATTTDIHGNIVVPNMSTEVLRLALLDEEAIREAAQCHGIKLVWRPETSDWLKTALTLLTCRNALIENKIELLISELTQKNIKLGIQDFELCKNMQSTEEFEILERFAIETMTEKTLRTAVVFVAKQPLPLESELMDHPVIQSLIDTARRPLFMKKTTPFYDNLIRLFRLFHQAISGCILGSEHRIFTCREAVLAIIRSPASDLIDFETIVHAFFRRLVASHRQTCSLMSMAEMVKRDGQQRSSTARQPANSGDVMSSSSLPSPVMSPKANHHDDQGSRTMKPFSFVDSATDESTAKQSKPTVNKSAVSKLFGFVEKDEDKTLGVKKYVLTEHVEESVPDPDFNPADTSAVDDANLQTNRAISSLVSVLSDLDRLRLNIQTQIQDDVDVEVEAQQDSGGPCTGFVMPVTMLGALQATLNNLSPVLCSRQPLWAISLCAFITSVQESNSYDQDCHAHSFLHSPSSEVYKSSYHHELLIVSSEAATFVRDLRRAAVRAGLSLEGREGQGEEARDDGSDGDNTTDVAGAPLVFPNITALSALLTGAAFQKTRARAQLRHFISKLITGRHSESTKSVTGRDDDDEETDDAQLSSSSFPRRNLCEELSQKRSMLHCQMIMNLIN